MRSIVPSEENPACSASRANATISGPFTPRVALGSPIATSISMPPSSGSSSLDQLPGWAHDLLAAARVAHLGLLDADGRPRVLPVTYACAGGALWTAVDHKPKTTAGAQLARVRWL